MGIHCTRSRKEYRMLETYMALPIQDQVNILHGIRGVWTMRSEIINALWLREVANQREIMEEGSFIPRGREPPENEALLNTTIQVLTCTCHKWIVDPDPIKVQPNWHICTHENTWHSLRAFN